MFFEKVKRLLNNIGVRLALWFAAFFFLSLVILSLHESWLFSLVVREHNRGMVMHKIDKYSSIEKKGGLDQLLEELEQDHDTNTNAGLFVLVRDHDGATRWITLPYGWEKLRARYLEKSASLPPEKWRLLRAGRDRSDREGFSPTAERRRRLEERWRRRSDKDLDIFGRILTNDMTLQIGKAAAGWEELMHHLGHAYVEVLLTGTLLALIGGIFLSRRALRPIRDLIDTVQRIETGKMDARVPPSKTRGELDELVRLFNQMLARIEILVNGMREALDNVAHDFRTPIARMKASVESALQSENDAEALKEALSDCAEDLETIVKMLNALMDTSEAETGVMKLDFEDFDISSLLEEVVDVYRYVAEEKDIAIETSISQEIVLNADRARIRQVIANLLDNSIKYTHEGSVKIAARTENGQAIISFADTGEGIAPEDIPRIFDRLYRGDRSRSQRGLGLGLSFVKAVVKAHGGWVTVDSKLNEGSAFTLVLPSAQNR